MYLSCPDYFSCCFSFQWIVSPFIKFPKLETQIFPLSTSNHSPVFSVFITNISLLCYSITWPSPLP
jgi:hypothetical protein